MIRIMCNRCGVDMTDDKAFGEITIKAHESPDFDTSFRWIIGESEGEHYCEKCMEEITEFIRDPGQFAKALLAPVGAAEPPDDKIPSDAQEGSGRENQRAQGATEKKARKKIDYGKVMALKRAGWDNAKIADEMGMTKASVATAISTYKKKLAGGDDECSAPPVDVR